MMQYKACPRCRGDLRVSRDIYGGYRQCLQCGYMFDFKKADGRSDLPDPRQRKEEVA